MPLTTAKQAELLKALKSTGWNQADLARSSRLWPQEVGKILNLRAKPTTEQAIKIVKAFQENGTEINSLLLWLEDSLNNRKK
jgi:transcriptional regulator with XRE-family HTH domain